MAGGSETLIVGAGPVGLTMAAALAYQGIACRIIDKAPAPSDRSKALVVWCRTLELLDGLGLAETFVAAGLKLSGGSIYAEGKKLVHLGLVSDESPFGFPLMIPQNETERLLTEHLARQGVAIERQVELMAFRETPAGVECSLRHADGREERVVTPWLNGCDGAHSTVRHGLGLEFTGHAEPNDWLLADIHVAGALAHDEVSVFWHERGVLAFFPINRDRFRMIADLGPTAADGSLAPAPTLAEAQAKVDERGPKGLRFSDPIWLANFRINERKVKDYRLGRVMLAGDAAHIHSPAGGQGMNTGMQDAFNLAWKLALIARGQGRAEPLLASYSHERSEVGDQVLSHAERVTQMATLRNPAAQWLRNHLAPIVSSFQFVQDKIRNDWFELSINYRTSKLSGEGWPAMTGGLAAGDRMCDAPLTALDRSAGSVFGLLRRRQHVVLLLAGAQADQTLALLVAIADELFQAFPGVVSPCLVFPAEAKAAAQRAPAVYPAFFDATGRLHEKLAAREPTVVVVRPDGYIAFRSQPASGAAIMANLERYLVRADRGP